MRSVKKGDKKGLLPPRQQRLVIHLLRQLILIELEHIRHLADGDVRAIIKVMPVSYTHLTLPTNSRV